MALGAAGFAVVAVEDGIDALRQVDAGAAPAAVVLDLELPRLGGQDVQRELRSHADTRTVPIVVVTGTRAELNPYDYSCVLRKPIDPDTLVAAVEDSIRRARVP